MWCIMPRKEVSSGFFRIQNLVTLGLSVLGALSVGMFHSLEANREPIVSFESTRIYFVLLAVFSFLGTILWRLERREGATKFAGLIFVLSLLTIPFYTMTSKEFGVYPGWLHLISEISSAAILGSAMTAMLLGHWYLTAPTMSIEPLRYLNSVFGFAVGVRFLLSVMGILNGVEKIDSTTQWMWLSLRWFSGIIGPAIVVVMVLQILKLKNTQSATGVLFVGVILTLLGELSATLLFRELNLAM